MTPVHGCGTTSPTAVSSASGSFVVTLSESSGPQHLTGPEPDGAAPHQPTGASQCDRDDLCPINNKDFLLRTTVDPLADERGVSTFTCELWQSLMIL